jgi:regulator of nonsense transcripts 1
MDEATQAHEPSALIPLIYGATKVVMVGDQCQLGPICITQEMQAHNYDVSLFERLIKAPGYHVMLDRQFRMHPAISAFPNRQFYSGRIQDGITAAARQSPRLQCFSKQNLPLQFIDVAGRESTQRSSFANENEVDVVVNIVQHLSSRGIAACNIGVITPYRAQVQRLESRLTQTTYPGIKIATVDSFQGGECDYIIMSCVRSGPKIGFVKDVRRMNVSLTRARYGLVIVGHKDALSQESAAWRALCDHCEAQGVLVVDEASAEDAPHSATSIRWDFE